MKNSVLYSLFEFCSAQRLLVLWICCLTNCSTGICCPNWRFVWRSARNSVGFVPCSWNSSKRFRKWCWNSIFCSHVTLWQSFWKYRFSFSIFAKYYGLWFCFPCTRWANFESFSKIPAWNSQEYFLLFACAVRSGCAGCCRLDWDE